MQDWSSTEIINSILDSNCKIKEQEHLTSIKRPFSFEIEKIKRTLTSYVESASGEGHGL